MNRPSAGEPRVVFLHIGRTGGTTLGRILVRETPRDRVRYVDSARLDAALVELAALPDDEKAALRAIRGHVTFGVHELLPPPVTYVTLVREPIDRVVSHYHYVRSRPYHALHEEVTRRRLRFADYVTSGISLELDNWQTRVLAGDLETPFGGCGPETLERARANVEEWFAVAGLLERFDETAVLCRRVLAWPRPPLHSRRNAGRGRPACSSLSDAELDAALATNRLDVELYAWIAARFDAAIAADPGFERELRAFRTLNALYAPWGRLQVRTTELVRDVVRGRPREPGVSVANGS